MPYLFYSLYFTLSTCVLNPSGLYKLYILFLISLYISLFDLNFLVVNMSIVYYFFPFLKKINSCDLLDSKFIFVKLFTGYKFGYHSHFSSLPSHLRGFKYLIWNNHFRHQHQGYVEGIWDVFTWGVEFLFGITYFS